MSKHEPVFNCTRCGICCMFVDPVLEKPGPCSKLVMENDGKYTCSIYNERPEVCRVGFGRERFNKDNDCNMDLNEWYKVNELMCDTLKMARAVWREEWANEGESQNEEEENC